MNQPLGTWVQKVGAPTHVGNRTAVFNFDWKECTITAFVEGKDKIVTEARVSFKDVAKKLSLSFVDAVARSFGLAPVPAPAMYRWCYGRKTGLVQVSVLDSGDETMDITTPLGKEDDIVIIDNIYELQDPVPRT